MNNNYFIAIAKEKYDSAYQESSLNYKEMYKKVMKELESIFTCHLCNKKSEDGIRYISEHDTSIVYCSTSCRNIRGWIGHKSYII
jgi:hypothetical protein